MASNTLQDDCQMSPSGFITLWTIRRPSYKSTVAPNIYITTCYVVQSYLILYLGNQLSMKNNSTNGTMMQGFDFKTKCHSYIKFMKVPVEFDYFLEFVHKEF